MCCDGIDHVKVANHVGEESQGTGWLWNFIQVDKCVNKSCTGEHPENIECCSIGRVGRGVQGSQDEEWGDVLDVVKVTSPYTLHILISKVNFIVLLVSDSVLGIGKNLEFRTLIIYLLLHILV